MRIFSSPVIFPLLNGHAYVSLQTRLAWSCGRDHGTSVILASTHNVEFTGLGEAHELLLWDQRLSDNWWQLECNITSCILLHIVHCLGHIWWVLSVCRIRPASLPMVRLINKKCEYSTFQWFLWWLASITSELNGTNRQGRHEIKPEHQGTYSFRPFFASPAES